MHSPAVAVLDFAPNHYDEAGADGDVETSDGEEGIDGKEEAESGFGQAAPPRIRPQLQLSTSSRPIPKSGLTIILDSSLSLSSQSGYVSSSDSSSSCSSVSGSYLSPAASSTPSTSLEILSKSGFLTGLPEEANTEWPRCDSPESLSEDSEDSESEDAFRRILTAPLDFSLQKRGKMRVAPRSNSPRQRGLPISTEFDTDRTMLTPYDGLDAYEDRDRTLLTPAVAPGSWLEERDDTILSPLPGVNSSRWTD